MTGDKVQYQARSMKQHVRSKYQPASTIGSLGINGADYAANTFSKILWNHGQEGENRLPKSHGQELTYILRFRLQKTTSRGVDCKTRSQFRRATKGQNPLEWQTGSLTSQVLHRPRLQLLPGKSREFIQLKNTT